MLGHILDNFMYVALAFGVLVIVGILVYLAFWKFSKRKKKQKPPSTYSGTQSGKKAPLDVTDIPSQTSESISNLNFSNQILQSRGAQEGSPSPSPINIPSRTPGNAADNLNDSSDLKPLLEKLLEEIQGIRASLNDIAGILQDQVPSQTRNSSSHSPERDSSSHSPERVGEKPSQHELMRPTLQEFCDLYNAGVQNSQQQRNLQENYKLNYRIGVVNTDERRRNSNTSPIFESDTAGDLQAFHIKSENLYAVVPLYGLTLGRSLYGPGAFGEVFECPNFNSGHSYHFKVIQPAFFEPDDAKQRWTLKAKGKLDLIPSE